MSRAFFTRNQQQSLRLSVVEVSETKGYDPIDRAYTRKVFLVSMRQLGAPTSTAVGIGSYDTHEEAMTARTVAQNALYHAHQWEAQG